MMWERVGMHFGEPFAGLFLLTKEYMGRCRFQNRVRESLGLKCYGLRHWGLVRCVNCGGRGQLERGQQHVRAAVSSVEVA